MCPQLCCHYAMRPPAQPLPSRKGQYAWGQMHHHLKQPRRRPIAIQKPKKCARSAAPRLRSHYYSRRCHGQTLLLNFDLLSAISDHARRRTPCMENSTLVLHVKDPHSPHIVLPQRSRQHLWASLSISLFTEWCSSVQAAGVRLQKHPHGVKSIPVDEHEGDDEVQAAIN